MHALSAAGWPLPRRGVWPLAAALALVPQGALAHDGPPPTPDNLWRTWNFDPAILLWLLVAAYIYARGLSRMGRRVGRGKVAHPWRAVAFAGGLIALAVALVSPLDPLGAALFSAHMVQHLILILVAAPLLVLAEPLGPALRALPPGRRRVAGSWWAVLARSPLTALPVAWILHAAAVWGWHLPRPYGAALGHTFVHALEHAAFLGTALLFWWACLHPRGGRLGYGMSVLALFAMATQGGVFGALITFADTPWYPGHAPGTAAWGLSPLADQQLAGLIMWIPAGFVYLLATAALFVAWFGALERRSAEPVRWPTRSVDDAQA